MHLIEPAVRPFAAIERAALEAHVVELPAVKAQRRQIGVANRHVRELGRLRLTQPRAPVLAAARRARQLRVAVRFLERRQPLARIARLDQLAAILLDPRTDFFIAARRRSETRVVFRVEDHLPGPAPRNRGHQFVIRLLKRIGAVQVGTLIGELHQRVDVDPLGFVLECGDEHRRAVVEQEIERDRAVPPQHADAAIGQEPRRLLLERQPLDTRAAVARHERDRRETRQFAREALAPRPEAAQLETRAGRPAFAACPLVGRGLLEEAQVDVRGPAHVGAVLRHRVERAGPRRHPLRALRPVGVDRAHRRKRRGADTERAQLLQRRRAGRHAERVLPRAARRRVPVIDRDARVTALRLFVAQ
ncbi:hypothetical protein DP49_6997 [Burkholderia pseudomallei]|nr:hypothetical protein DP49_6997 [Burkholderia pseudomallei]